MARIINEALEQVSVGLLKHHPRNANNGDVEAIKKSLAVNGWYGSVVANKRTKHIVAGNHRVMAAKALGWDTVPVQWIDVTDEEELRILIVDNRTTRIGQDDTIKIADILSELASTPIGLDGTGYGAADLDALIDEIAGMAEPEELLTDPDEVPENVETRCKPGDLWILGNHRLLCGDSTKAEDVGRLMGDSKIDVVVTDPPYGIDASNMTLGTGKKNFVERGDWDKQKPDIRYLATLASQVIIWGGNYFADQLPVTNNWLCWWKKNDGLSFSEFELAWTNLGKNCRHLSHHWSGEQKEHPTQKPMPVIEWCIALTNGLIFDPFLGSGTTLIAAEKTKRCCYGMEISPKYCDVIITRWENATGKKAVLDG